MALSAQPKCSQVLHHFDSREKFWSDGFAKKVSITCLVFFFFVLFVYDGHFSPAEPYPVLKQRRIQQN